METNYYSKAVISLYLFVGISISTFTATTSAGNIYKCVRPNGEVEYTQSPSENCDVQKLKKSGGSADQKAVENLNQDQVRARIAADEQREEELRLQDKERTDEEMEEYCEIMRKNLNQITIATRVFETDDQGTRTRLTEEQRKQRVQENQDSLDEHCS